MVEAGLSAQMGHLGPKVGPGSTNFEVSIAMVLSQNPLQKIFQLGQNTVVN